MHLFIKLYSNNFSHIMFQNLYLRKLMYYIKLFIYFINSMFVINTINNTILLVGLKITRFFNFMSAE